MRYFIFFQLLGFSAIYPELSWIPASQAGQEYPGVTRGVIPADTTNDKTDDKTNDISSDEILQQFFHDLQLHLQRYPELQAEDVYKFCYQAFLGIGHQIADKDQALYWLQKDVKALDEPWAGDTLLIEPMGATYVRLHLHPYLRYQESLDKLAEAMLQSLSAGVDSIRFQAAWSEILNMSLKEDWHGPTHNDLVKLTQTLESQNFPVIHHSDRTKMMYRFHYRVLSLPAAQDLLKSQAMDVRSFCE